MSGVEGVGAALGGEVVRARPLRGGTHRQVTAVDVAVAGTVRRVVVRGFGSDGEVAAREAAVLRWLEAARFPAPRLLAALDDRLAMTRLPGRPTFAPRDVAAWTGELARMLAALHRLPVGDGDGLPDRQPELARYLEVGPPPEDRTHRDCARLWDALRRLRPRISTAPPVLTHGDYFPGNVCWSRGRIRGVVDWDDAGLADPRLDVGNCRAELAIHPGGAAPDLFLAAYEAELGPVADRPYWDLIGAQWLFPDPERYRESLQSRGAGPIAPGTLAARLRGFIAAALAG